MQWSEERLQTERDKYEGWLLQQPFVTGVGIGYDEQGRLALKIMTDAASATDRTRIRMHLQGVPISFEEIGPVEAL